MALQNQKSLILITVLLTIGVHQAAAAELRCEVLCNFESLREQCERCKLRVPMRFGKRSSPPEDLLLIPEMPSSSEELDLAASPDDGETTISDEEGRVNDDALTRHFFRLLARSMRGLSDPEKEVILRQLGRHGIEMEQDVEDATKLTRAEGRPAQRWLRQQSSVANSRQKRTPLSMAAGSSASSSDETSSIVQSALRKQRGWKPSFSSSLFIRPAYSPSSSLKRKESLPLSKSN